MRRAAKVDRNQAEIVAALRSAGVTVQPLHTVGDGCPDLLCGFRRHNFLLECKMPGTGKLTPDQIEWHGGWKGQVIVVEDAEAALAVVMGMPLRGVVS